LSIDLANPSILYYGAHHLFQTIDGAGSWDAIFEVPYQYGIIMASTSAPSDSDTVYLASNENNGVRIHLSRNATAGSSSTWSDITNALPDQFVTQIAVDPAEPGLAYVAYS